MSKVPVLKVKTETFHTVDYNDLEVFIKETTGQTYEVACGEEWGNDSQHRVRVDGVLATWEQKNWDKFKASGELDQESFLLRAIMNGLCSEGKLPAGTYLVDVCW